MAVRNFWIESHIDGAKTALEGGPRNKEGGMRVTLKQRNDGAIDTALKIECREIDGELVTEVYHDSQLVYSYTTKR